MRAKKMGVGPKPYPWELCQFVAGCTLDRLTLGHKPTLNRVAHDSGNLLRADHAVAVKRHRELQDHIAVNQVTNLGRTVGLTSGHLGDYSVRESDQLTLSLGRARLGATLAGLGGLLGHVLKLGNQHLTVNIARLTLGESDSSVESGQVGELGGSHKASPFWACAPLRWVLLFPLLTSNNIRPFAPTVNDFFPSTFPPQLF